MLFVRPALGAVLTAAALAAAGCGSSSGGDGPSTPAKPAAAAAPAPSPTGDGIAVTGPRPSKTAYVKQADKVCQAAGDVSRSANAVVRKAFQAGDTKGAADAIDNYTPLYAKQVAKLKALRQPKNAGLDKKVLGGLIKVMDHQVDALRAESAALRQQDSATLQSISQSQQQSLQFAETLGKQYGFKVCGRAA
jgi:hypothetical protein